MTHTPPPPANENHTDDGMVRLPIIARVDVGSGRITTRPDVPEFDVVSAGLGVLLLAETPRQAGRR